MTGRAPAAILLAGAVVLAGWALALVPRDFTRTPVTPFDRSDPRLAESFRFLSAAREALPPDAAVTVVAEPRDPVRETALYDAAVALLPPRRTLPAAEWDSFTPRYELEAEYVLVFGPRPAAPPGTLLADLPGGFAYRRPRR